MRLLARTAAGLLAAWGWCALALEARAETGSGGARQCLALAAYWEAKAEGRAGMQAVAAVVMNRVAHPEFPDSVCGVVEQGGETPPCQFSWWCDGKSDVPREPGPWALAREVAAEALADALHDRTGGALFFHNTTIAEPWRIERTRTVRIGRHVFYR